MSFGSYSYFSDGMSFTSDLQITKKPVPRSLIETCLSILDDEASMRKFKKEGCCLRKRKWTSSTAFWERREKLDVSKDVCSRFWKKMTQSDEFKWRQVLNYARPLVFTGFGKRVGPATVVPTSLFADEKQPSEDEWSVLRSAVPGVSAAEVGAGPVENQSDDE